MSQHKALAYAEDQLGVHRVWSNTEQLVMSLQDVYRTHAGFEIEVRDLAFKIDQRKNVILVNESNGNPELNVTAFERHIKRVQAEDEDLATLNKLHLEATGRRDSTAADIRGMETNLKAHNARMFELGGYFQYLASSKNAQIVRDQQMNDYPW